jgi:hypothetical protein
MSQPTSEPGDRDRQHPESAAEGSDDPTAAAADQPREHTEDPAEG